MAALFTTAAASAAAASAGWFSPRHRRVLPALLTAAALAGLACFAWPRSLYASNALVLSGGAAAGMLIGRFLRSVGALVTFTIVAAVVDVFSVARGPTRWLLEAKSHSGLSALRFLAICAPAEGRLLAVIGAGDLLLTAAIAAAMAGLGYRLRAAVIVPVAALIAAVILGLAWRPMPAIPFLAVAVAAFVAANPAPPARLPV